MRVGIVGGGITGLATAWALTRRGADVTLFEQGPVPNPLSASGDQHRLIRRAYGRMSGYARMIGEAYAAWDELWADLGECHLADTGFLIVSQHEGDSAEAYRDGLIAADDPCEVLNGRDAAERWPFLDPDVCRWAAYSPEGGALLCEPIAVGLARLIREGGGMVHENARVESIDTSAGTLVAAGEPFAFDQLVVAAGAWVTGLCPDLAGRLTAYRTAVAYLTPPDDLENAWAHAPGFLDLGGTIDGYVLPPVRGTGLKVGTGLHKRVSPPDADREPEDWEGAAIRDRFTPFARLDEYGIDHVRSCVYTFTIDERFFAERRGRAWVVSACSGHGYKFGAAIGRRMADALLERTDPVPWLEARAA